MGKSWEHELDMVGLKFRMKKDLRLDFQRRVAKKPVTVTVEREPDNEYDPNAVAVLLDGYRIGYFRRDSAELLAPRLDAGEITVTSAKVMQVDKADTNDAFCRVLVTFKDSD